ncbi:M56 family metallopeptidase [Chryseobacterium sp. T1]
METLLLYLGKMILCSAVMYAYYILFLKDKTFHHYNRFYLLLTVIISLFLPLLKVSYFTMEINNKLLLLIANLQSQPINSHNDGFSIYTIFSLLFGLVSILFLGKLGYGILKINHIKKQFPNEKIEGINFYHTNLEEAPFSFFRHLFWKKSIEIQSSVGQQILKHEMVHIEQKHTWDKLFMQLVKAIFWMNPMFYIINKEINLIHEYLADNKAVKRSDTKAFAQMLLASHFPGRTLPATSPFLSSNLKKRLKMLTKSKPKYSYARRIFALPLLFSLSFAYLVNAKNKEIKKTNIAIDLAVENLQKDTLTLQSASSEVVEPIKPTQNALIETNEQIAKDNQKIAEINQKIAEKNKSISEMIKAKKTKSEDFAQKGKEVDYLQSQVDGLVNSDRYKDLLKKSDEYSKKMEEYFNSAEFNKKIADAEKRAAEVDAKFNSPEFKKRIADAEKRAAEADAKFNSPEFKKRIADAEKRAAEADAKFNSPEFKKRIADAEKRAKDLEIKFISAKFKKRSEDGKKNNSNVIILPNNNFSFSNSFDVADLGKIFDLRDVKFDNKEVQELLAKLPNGKDMKGGGAIVNFNDFAFGRELTAKEKRQYEKRQKKIKELQEEINKKRKELKQDLPLVGSPWVLNSNFTDMKPASTNLYKNNTRIIIDGKNLDELGRASGTKFYLNGEEVSSETIQSIDNNNIKNININKANGKSELSIETRK